MGPLMPSPHAPPVRRLEIVRRITKFAPLALLVCGGSTVAIRATAAEPLFAAPVNFQTGDSPSFVAVADFNADGRLDLVTANWMSNTVSVLLGNGNGSFQAKRDHSTRNSPRFVAIQDLDQDGARDLVTANADATSISVLYGSAFPNNGSFPARIDFYVGYDQVCVAIGDLNGDGFPDLAVPYAGVVPYSFGALSVLLADGTGGFGAGIDLLGTSRPVLVAIADLNGDGPLDLAVACVAGPKVMVLLNNGNGTFRTVSEYATGVTPNSLAIADLNKDGKLDLAMAGGSSVSVLLGRGDGTFGVRSNYASGPVSSHAAIGDLNGDGKPDVVVAHDDYDHSMVSVLLGNGDGTFQAPSDYATGRAPTSVAIGDFNGDGKPDLATANGWDNTVSVLLNIGVPGTPALVALVSADAEPGRVIVQWYVSGDADPAVTVYRRTGSESWHPLGPASSGTGNYVRYEDTDVEPGVAYGYCLGISSGGEVVLTGEVWVTVPAGYALALEGARPNPATEGLRVSFSLPDGSPAELEVFNVAGRRVLSRKLQGMGPGQHVVALDGGMRLSAGVYVVRLSHGGRSLTARAVVAR